MGDLTSVCCTASGTATITAMPKVLCDFIDPNVANVWHAIDDRFMGGTLRYS